MEEQLLDSNIDGGGMSYRAKYRRWRNDFSNQIQMIKELLELRVGSTSRIKPSLW
jgi:hypothetical protein